MTITTAESEMLDRRDDLTQVERDIVDETFQGLYNDMKERGLRGATDDRAAKLEASLMQFMFDSREGTDNVRK